MSFFNVDILTPQSALARGIEADSVLIPTTTGEIQVLPNHTHIVTELSTGALTIKQGNSVTQYSITTGTCRVLNNKITILSNVCEKAELIDLERAESALSGSQTKLLGNSLNSEDEYVKYQRKLERAKLRIELSKNFKKN